MSGVQFPPWPPPHPNSVFSDDYWGYDWGYLSRAIESTPTFAMLTDSEIRKSSAKDRDFKLFDNSPSGRAIRAPCPRPASASQRRDSDSPHGISGADALASVATSLWQGMNEQLH